MSALTPLARMLPCLALALALCPANAGEHDRESLSLNGLWDFFPDGGATRHEIRVPSFWDAPQDYGYPEEWLHMRHGIYRRAFRLPESMRDKVISLKISRVSVIAKVFLNGHRVGAEDSNGYLMMQLPYVIDVTSLVKFDADNQLEVQVWGGKSMIHGSDSQDNLMKEDDFPADTKIDGRFLYPYCVDHWDGRRGLNGDVSILACPKVHVADMVITPELHKNRDPADDELLFRLTVANRDTRSRKVQVRSRAAPVRGAREKTFETVTITLPPQSCMQIFHSPAWPDAAYWWPHDPQLYVLETTLIEQGSPIDSHSERFGFRQFYVRGDHFELNGIRANLRGDAYEFSWHEGFRHGPSTAPVFSTKELIPRMQQQLVREYQKLNHNVLRPHKASGIDELYDACDELGMMVLDEAPFWETWVRTDERAKPNFEAWIRRWVRERRNHASLIAWIASNECWFGPTAAILLQAVRSEDTSRPAFNEDPWGPVAHTDTAEPLEGDEDCRHYTGGYPMKAFNTEALYEVYLRNPNKPTGEGESLFPDGFPLLNADGTLSAGRSQRGEFGNPDMISQPQWLRGVCRLVRAMRYAAISDARLYASWMYAFDPIEADLTLEWPDLAAPGIKPVVVRRPMVNVFTDQHPAARPGAGYEYYRASFAPVAVFDKEADRQNRIGAQPVVFKPKDSLRRTLVLYNDEFHGGTEMTVRWTAQSLDPRDNQTRTLAQGSCSVAVPYGERREQAVTIPLPERLPDPAWLELTLAACKASSPTEERFHETTRLGALHSIPAPKLAVSPGRIDLGPLRATDTPQWHKLLLVNAGGGASEKWTLTGGDSPLHFNLTSGNLRGEQEIYFQIRPAGLKPGPHQRELRISGEHGSSQAATVRFTLVE